MKKNLKIASIGVTTIAAMLLSAGAWAQDNTRNWEETTVWSISEVHTKPGMLNAYINDLDNVWRKFVEAQKKDGDVVSYRLFVNSFARAGEPDLFLAVEFKNWAAFDRGVEYFEKQAEKIMGSLDDMQEANIDREELRKLGGQTVLQEIEFKD